jgi:sulfur-oxidizing protein SoxY
MERRKFLSLTLGALALAVVPASVRAEDYRKTKPSAWSAHTVEDGIKNLYGTNATINEGVKLKAPKIAANGGAIPVDFSTKIPAKSIAVFQDSNPESAVCVYSVNEYSINEYSIKMKMAKSGSITVVVQGQDGKLYSAKQSLEVALGGCEG